MHKSTLNHSVKVQKAPIWMIYETSALFLKMVTFRFIKFQAGYFSHSAFSIPIEYLSRNSSYISQTLSIYVAPFKHFRDPYTLLNSISLFFGVFFFCAHLFQHN